MAQKLGLKINVNTAEAAKKIDSFLATYEGKPITLNLELNTKSIDSAISKLSSLKTTAAKAAEEMKKTAKKLESAMDTGGKSGGKKKVSAGKSDAAKANAELVKVIKEQNKVNSKRKELEGLINGLSDKDKKVLGKKNAKGTSFLDTAKQQVEDYKKAASELESARKTLNNVKGMDSEDIFKAIDDSSNKRTNASKVAAESVSIVERIKDINKANKEAEKIEKDTDASLKRSKNRAITLTKLRSSLASQKSEILNGKDSLSGNSLKEAEKQAKDLEKSIKAIDSIKGDLSNAKVRKKTRDSDIDTLAKNLVTGENIETTAKQRLADSQVVIDEIKNISKANKEAEKAEKNTVNRIKQAKNNANTLTSYQNSVKKRISEIESGQNLLSEDELKQSKADVKNLKKIEKEYDSVINESQNAKVRKKTKTKDEESLSGILTRGEDLKSRSKNILASSQASVNAINSQKKSTNAILNAKKDITELGKTANSLTKVKSNIENNMFALSGSVKTNAENYVKNIDAQVDSLNSMISKLKTTDSSKLMGETGYLAESKNLKVDSKQTLADVQKFYDAEAKIQKLRNETVTYDKYGNRMSEYWSKYGRQLQTNIPLLNKYNTLVEKINNRSFGSTKELGQAFADFRIEARAAGVEIDTFGSKLKRSFAGNLRSQIAQHSLTAISMGVTEMIRNAVEIDTSLTELKKVTNGTDSDYEQFMENAATRAETIGASLNDVVSASADYARLGYDISDASKLADASLLYLNVGDDVEDIDQASKSLISTMQGFGIEADNINSIVDKFNEVANNYASSAGDIGEITMRSAAAMSAAGNDLDETIALGVAANEVQQDA